MPTKGTFDVDAAIKEYRELRGKKFEYGEAADKVNELTKTIQDAERERDKLEEEKGKYEKKINSFFSRESTKDKLREEMEKIESRLKKIEEVQPGRLKKLEEETTKLNAINSAHLENLKKAKDLAIKILSSKGSDKNIAEELENDLNSATEEWKKLQEEQTSIAKKIEELEKEMPGLFISFFNSESRKDRNAALSEILAERNKLRKVNRQLSKAEADKKGAEVRKEFKDKDAASKTSGQKLESLFKNLQKTKKGTAQWKEAKKAYLEALNKEGLDASGKKSDKIQTIRFMNQGDISEELFEDVKQRAQKKADKEKNEYNRRMGNYAARGKNYYSSGDNRENRKKDVDKCIRDCTTIIKVMQDLKKNFPTGLPYPGQEFVVNAVGVVDRDKLGKNPEDWKKIERVFRSPAYVKRCRMEYSQILKSLELLFGAGGFLQILADSPFTDQRPNKYGFVNLAQAALAAYDELELTTLENLYKRTENFVSSDKDADNPRSKEQELNVRAAVANIESSISGSLDDVGKILEPTQGMEEAKKALEENKKNVADAMVAFNKSFEGAHTLKKKVEKLGEIIGLATLVLGCIKTEKLKGAAQTVSKVLQFPFLMASKIINIFGIERVYGPEFKTIQQDLEYVHKKLHDKYVAAHKLFKFYSKELLKKEYGEQGLLNEKSTEMYTRLMNDWSEIALTLSDFSKKLMNESQKYKPIGLHIHKYTKLLQQAKWEVTSFMRNGVFDTSADKNYLITRIKVKPVKK